MKICPGAVVQRVITQFLNLAIFLRVTFSSIVIFMFRYVWLVLLGLGPWELTIVGEMFLDRLDWGTTWSNPQTSSTNLVVIDEPDLGQETIVITTCSSLTRTCCSHHIFHIVPLCASHITRFSRHVFLPKVFFTTPVFCSERNSELFHTGGCCD